MALTEHETRGQLIDRQLEKAGWRLDDCTQVRREVPADEGGHEAPPVEYKVKGSDGITDNCLYDSDGCILSVIECKRTSRSPREGENLRHCRHRRATAIRPFGFMANGLTTFSGRLANPAHGCGFFSRADLQRLRFIRENRQLGRGAINRAIVDVHIA